MNGAMTVEVMIDAGEVDGLYNTALLRQIDEAEEAVRLIERNDLSVGHAFSLTDISKEVHQALNANRSEFFKIPDSSQLLAQEFLLFEGSGSSALRERVDSEFRRTRVTLKVPWADAIDYPDFLDELESTYGAILPAETRFGVTGVMALFGRVSSSLLTTMTRSYLIALAVITPLMILFLGSFRRGVFSMIPNLAPILLTLGVMGWLGIPLDITSLMVGGIIIGLAVDDTIHFMHRFNRVYARTGDPRKAIRETLQATGRAMLFTSVVLASGFFVFGLAHMENISTFGLLAGMATLLAFLADVTLAPAMMLRLTETGDRQAGS
jgi:predicted RND superfamily exporter protein